MSKYTQPFIYTILTENKNIKEVQGILDKWFGGYNISLTDSRYDKKNEQGLRIEIIGGDVGKVELVCKEIKELNKQDQVWYKREKTPVFVV